MGRNVTPFGQGKGGHNVKTGQITATFPLSTEMAGWHITNAEVDEAGYFLTVLFEQETP